jgi:hypothetical protein
MIREECNPSCTVVQKPVMGTSKFMQFCFYVEIALISSNKISFLKLDFHFIE